jgi:hypothetical protein
VLFAVGKFGFVDFVLADGGYSADMGTSGQIAETVAERTSDVGDSILDIPIFEVAHCGFRIVRPRIRGPRCPEVV